MLIEVIETSADSYAVLQPGLRVWLPHMLFMSSAPEALCLMEALHEVHFVQGRLSGHPLLIALPLCF